MSQYLPTLFQMLTHKHPGSRSPPHSGCSEVSTPERFSPQHQLADKSVSPSSSVAITPSKQSSPDDTRHNMEPKQHMQPKCSFSPEDLDAAAAMLELPTAAISTDSASNADSTGLHQPNHAFNYDASGFYEADASQASAASAAELLLAAGRLASVSSQNSSTEGFINTRASLTEAYTPSRSRAAAMAASTAAATAAAAVATHAPSALFAAAGPHAVAAAEAAAAARLAASRTPTVMGLDRPIGCSCLKPCKPHAPCQQCGSPHSPGHTWRAGPAGPGTLCNACGTRYSRSRQKQLAAAAAAATAAGYGASWDGSFSASNSSDKITSRLGSGSSAGGSSFNSFNKTVRPKQGRVSKAGSSSKVVKGASSRGGRGPASPVAVLHQQTAERSVGLSPFDLAIGGAATGSQEEEQQQWWLHWQTLQQQQQQQQQQGEEEVVHGQDSAEGQEQTAEELQRQQQQQQQQQWLLYSQWMQQQQMLFKLHHQQQLQQQ